MQLTCFCFVFEYELFRELQKQAGYSGIPRWLRQSDLSTHIAVIATAAHY